MQIELISIGDELLSGKTINTNATLIAEHLLRQGLTLSRIHTIPDDRATLLEILTQAFARCDLILTTGGLGPTGDDITKEIIAEFFDSPLEYDQEIAEELQHRYGNNLSSITHQATIPKKAQIIPNKLGTAPGFLFAKEGKSIAVLPGVPDQMEAMLDAVFQYIKTNYTIQQKVYHQSLYFFGLSENEVDPLLRKLEEEHPDLQIGICPSYGILSVYLQLVTEEEKYAQKKLEQIKEEIQKPFQEHFFSEESKEIPRAIQALFIEKKWTLSLAESCTGGKVASKITSIPDSSYYFLGGIVSYSNTSKEALLHVQKDTLQSKGAVSAEVVREMCLGALDAFGSDYAIALSGVAGPKGGTEEKPVGTVWVAIGKRGESPHVGLLQRKGLSKREIVIEYATNIALGKLWQYAKYQTIPFKNT